MKEKRHENAGRGFASAPPNGEPSDPTRMGTEANRKESFELRLNLFQIVHVETVAFLLLAGLVLVEPSQVNESQDDSTFGVGELDGHELPRNNLHNDQLRQTTSWRVPVHISPVRWKRGAKHVYVRSARLRQLPPR